jgi:hypothetical protein
VLGEVGRAAQRLADDSCRRSRGRLRAIAAAAGRQQRGASASPPDDNGRDAMPAGLDSSAVVQEACTCRSF